MTEWTPERIAAVLGIRARLKLANASPHGWIIKLEDGAHTIAELEAIDDIAPLMDIGLAVLEADDATVTRLARAICIGGGLGPDEWWQEFEPEARAALQALTTQPAPPRA